MSTGGDKFNGGKPQFDLISPIALTQLAQVLTFGANKYAAHNWRKGIKFSYLIAAMHRHLAAISAGIDTDEESGLPHIAHLMCEAMFLCELQTSPHKKECDDRYELTPSQRELILRSMPHASQGTGIGTQCKQAG